LNSPPLSFFIRKRPSLVSGPRTLRNLIDYDRCARGRYLGVCLCRVPLQHPQWREQGYQRSVLATSGIRSGLRSEPMLIAPSSRVPPISSERLPRPARFPSRRCNISSRYTRATACKCCGGCSSNPSLQFFA
jgi:hypothetical protein